MGGTLDALKHLQEVERKLGELRGEEAVKRRQIQECERQLQKRDKNLEDKRSEIRRREAEIHSVELDVNSREQTIQKHRIALNQVKTNKDYAAILTTINTEKADTSKLESCALELMNVKDALRAAHDELVGERDKIEERRTRTEARLNAYLERTRSECAELTHERDEASAALPPTVMSTFDRAAERHDGEALAAVRKVNPKRDEFICAGCNMTVTLETINSLRTRDEVVQCSICGRILFLEE